MCKRKGLTLIELLVVIGIFATLVALLLAGVTHVREAALRLESANKLRQISIAAHHFASYRQGRLPSIERIGADQTLFTAILPYVGEGMRTNLVDFVPFFLSPADPTASKAIELEWSVSSYAANSQVFERGARLNASFPDGTSNTVAFAEHYAFDCQGKFFLAFADQLDFIGPFHRATFADFFDVTPETTGYPPTSGPTVGALTFQVAPALTDCNPHLAQTPHWAGMLAALADGSVRVLAPGMSTATYWGAVTPSKGELLGDDWNP